jgi:hypothetical protein
MNQIAEMPAKTKVPPQTLMLTLAKQVEQLEASSKLAAHYCATKMVPEHYQGKPEAGAVAIQWGAEIGMPPLQSLQNIAVINGNPALWGDALVALVKGSGQCEYLSSKYDADSQTSLVKTKRKGEPEEWRMYSMADATKAGLATRETYKRHPARMLHARARSHLLRDVYADLLRGMHIREIAEEDNDAYNLDGQQPEKNITPTNSDTLNTLLEKPESTNNFESRLNSANTLKELQAVATQVASSGERTDELLQTYFKRKEELTNV